MAETIVNCRDGDEMPFCGSDLLPHLNRNMNICSDVTIKANKLKPETAETPNRLTKLAVSPRTVPASPQQ